VIDEFLRIVPELERADAEEERVATDRTLSQPASKQLDAIAATTAEEREFNELRRELPLANSIGAAADVLFRHVRRVIPAANVTLFVPATETGELSAAATTGVGTSAVEGLTIPVGDRVSGWVMAHQQPVVNSNAALELGPVARTFSTPLRYVLAVPILNGNTPPIAVITCYGSEPFTADHRRILESCATLFATSLTAAANRLTLHPQTHDIRGSIVH
jgi:GAF domain-containing protein